MSFVLFTLFILYPLPKSHQNGSFINQTNPNIPITTTTSMNLFSFIPTLPAYIFKFPTVGYPWVAHLFLSLDMRWRGMVWHFLQRGNRGRGWWTAGTDVYNYGSKRGMSFKVDEFESRGSVAFLYHFVNQPKCCLSIVPFHPA